MSEDFVTMRGRIKFSDMADDQREQIAKEGLSIAEGGLRVTHNGESLFTIERDSVHTEMSSDGVILYLSIPAELAADMIRSVGISIESVKERWPNGKALDC